MSRRRYPASDFAAALTVLALAGIPLTAGAGGGPGDPDSRQETGTHFFGEVKEVAGFKPVEGARVKVAIKGTPMFLVVLTDEEGRFRLEGFGRDIEAKNIEVTCNKDGFRVVEALRRQVGKEAASPIEVECLLAPEKPRKRS